MTNMKKYSLILIAIALLILVVLIFNNSEKIRQTENTQDSISQGVTKKRTIIGDTSDKDIEKPNLEKLDVSKTVDSKCELLLNEDKHWEQLNKLSLQFEEYLSNSDSFESKQMSAIISLNERKRRRETDKPDFDALSDKRINKLSHLLTESPNSKLLNYHFTAACSNNPKNSNCTEDNIKRAIELDGNNGVVWANIASIYAEQGNTVAAIQALEQVYNAPLFDDFRMQRMAFFRDMINQSGLMQDNYLSIALNFELASSPISSASISKLCKQSSITSVDMVQACLNYGKRLEQDAKLMITKLIGLGIQQIVFNNINDKSSVSSVMKRRDRIMQFNSTLQSKSVQYLFSTNSDFQDYWFNLMSNYNEMEAFNLLNEEAERLTSDPSYNPCPTN